MSDRTEAPTPRRLRRAREEGDSGASGYAAQAVGFAVAVALLPAMARAVAARAAASLSVALSRAARPGGPLQVDSLEMVTAVAALVLPVLLAVGVAGGIAHLVQTGGVVTGKRLVPRLERLDPVAGLRGLFSAARLWSVLRALAAGALVGWLAYGVLMGHLVDLARLPGRAARVGRIGEVAAGAARTLAWQVALLGLAFGVIDVLVMRRAWLGRLRMTKAEVKREHEDAEGDPQIKAARARAHQEVMAQATLAGVRQASVVIVNPTHLACALRYDESEGDPAPVVVASGEGDFAARIVEAAREAGVPVVRDVPLARALLELEIGAAIPEALYEAVAEILREVWEDEGGRSTLPPGQTGKEQ